MATRTAHEEAKIGTRSDGVAGPIPEHDGGWMGPHLTSEQVWHALGKASFAVLGCVTPSGEPRCSGVVYRTIGRRLYVAVAPDSWKAKHVAASGRVAGDGAGAPGIPTRNHQFPRGGDRAPGRLTTGSLALG